MRQPDIEIYLREDHVPALLDWLGTQGELQLPAGKRQGNLMLNGECIPVQIIPKAAGKWTSIWFDSPDTPWATDAECAQAVFDATGQEVRCSVGTWQETDGEADADRWLKVNANGAEEFSWPSP